MPVIAPPDGGDLPPVNEPGFKPSGGRGGGPPGGGPGGGPFGGPGSVLGGGGTDPNVLRTLQGLNSQQLPLVLRRKGIPTPGVAPGPPGRTDTVPAMLTPGEMVMNTGVTQNPQLMQQLAMLNVQGAQQMQQQPVQGFSMGGRVCGYETGGQVPMNFCPHCGSPKPQGFAFGGAVGGANGVPQWAPQGAGMTPQPAQGIGNSTGGTNFFGGGGLGVQNIAGSGGWQRPPWLTPPSQQPFNYTHNAEGNTTNYNPNDPYGAFAHNLDPTAFGASQRQLGAYGNAGYFDPRGNQMLINSMNEGAQGTADALVRRNTTQADLSGLDPAQRAVAKQQALRDTGRGVQDIMANTRAQALGNANDFAQSLYNQQLQGAIGQYGQLTGARLGDWQAGNQQNRNNKNYWGDLAGGVIGAGVGGYFGRP